MSAAKHFLRIAGFALGAAMAANQVWAQPSGGLTQQAGATWTSATANNTALTLQIAGYSTIGITYSNNALVISSGNLNFEVDNGNNTWWPLQCFRLGGAVNESSYNMNGANQAWQCPVAGMVQARIRLNPVIVGNNAIISLQGSAGASMAGVLAASISSGNLNATITGGNSNITNLPVYGNIASNQQAVTTANTALQNVAGLAGICVETTTTSNASAFIGATGVSTANGMELPPGAAWCTNATNPNVIFVIAAANNTTTVSWAAMKP